MYHTFYNTLIQTCAFLILISSAQYGLSQPSDSVNLAIEDNPTAACCKSQYQSSDFELLSLEQLGQEFKRLRRLACEDCDNFGSHFMKIMDVLTKKLDGASKKLIKHTMGKPDRRHAKQLIYYWRGEHDYLIFDFSGSPKAKASWYYAYE